MRGDFYDGGRKKYVMMKYFFYPRHRELLPGFFSRFNTGPVIFYGPRFFHHYDNIITVLLLFECYEFI